MQMNEIHDDEFERIQAENDKFFKDAQYSLLGFVLISALLYLSVVLSSCNCYFTMVHTQGHATDVVDDAGAVNPNISPTIPITPGM